MSFSNRNRLGCENRRSYARTRKDQSLFIAGFGPSWLTLPPAANCTVRPWQSLSKKRTAAICTRILCIGRRSSRFGPSPVQAQSCFGHESWPTTMPVPQAWLEFDVESVAAETAELEAQGHRMLIRNKTEPWGQTVSRFMDPDGLLVELTFTPWLREKT
jgi:hypothetical protein